MNQLRRLFRRKAIDRFHSVDHFEQLLVINVPRAGFAALALAVSLAGALAWACIARIHDRAEGKGRFVASPELRDVAADAGGVVVACAVRPGDRLECGAIVARVGQPGLEREVRNYLALLEDLGPGPSEDGGEGRGAARARDRLAALVRKSRESLERLSAVRTPLAGVVERVDVAAGQSVAAGGRVATLRVERREPFYRLALGGGAGARGTFRLIAGGRATRPIRHDEGPGALRQALKSLPCFQGPGASVRADGSLAAGGLDLTVNPRDSVREGRDHGVLKVDDSGLFEADGTPGFATVTRLGGGAVPGVPWRFVGLVPTHPDRPIVAGMTMWVDAGSGPGPMACKVDRVAPLEARDLGDAGGRDLFFALGPRPAPTRLLRVEAVAERGPAPGPRGTRAGEVWPCRVDLAGPRLITAVLPPSRKWLGGN